MEILNPKWVLEVLRRELDVRGVSGREIDRRLLKLEREAVRQALGAGREGRLALEQLAALLEAAEIDAHAFFALVTGNAATLRSLVEILADREPPGWSRREKSALAVVAVRRPRGGADFAGLLPALRRVEELREEDPETAEALAWQALEQALEFFGPGAAAAALATLAGGSPRSKARALFAAVLEIVGDDPPAGLLAGKIYGNLGRVLQAAGYSRQALRLLRHRAYPDVDLDGGDGADRAALLLEMFRAARGAGELDFGIGCLERAIACGGDRLRFVALHELAATLFGLGRDPERTARHYDELVAMPHLAAAPPVARALARCFRVAAHFRADHLGPADLQDFETIWEEHRELLPTVERIRFALDFVAYLRQLGHDDQAGQLLLYEFWTVIELDEDVDGLQRKYMDAVKASQVELGPRLGVLRRPKIGDSFGQAPIP